MKIRQGITGFCDYKDRPLPEVDFKEFKAACFEVVRICDYASGSHLFSDDEYNFFQFGLTFRDRDIWIVCNRHYPVIAFVQPVENGDMELVHVDCPELAAEFEKVWGDCTVIDFAAAAEAIDVDSLSELNTAELDQVKYWKPSRVSEIVFNFWD